MTELPDYVESRIEREPMSGCWLWTGSSDQLWYGHSCMDRRTQRAHRVVWTLLKGPIAAGMQLNHKCKVRCCVNPDHLEEMTPYQNLSEPRSLSLGRWRNAPDSERVRPEHRFKYSPDRYRKNRENILAYQKAWRAKRKAAKASRIDTGVAA